MRLKRTLNAIPVDWDFLEITPESSAVEGNSSGVQRPPRGVVINLKASRCTLVYRQEDCQYNLISFRQYTGRILVKGV